MNDHDTVAAFTAIADEIRGEAAIAARPGQMDRLEAIADDIVRLAEGRGDLLCPHGRMWNHCDIGGCS